MNEEVKFQPLSNVLEERLKNGGRASILKVAEEMAAWTSSKLMNQLVHDFEAGSRTHSFLISEELTRRGIPPYFRSLALPLPEYSDCDVNRRFDLLVYDLRWIVASYPKHQTVAPRYMDIYKHRSIHKGAEHIAKQGNREVWEITRDMGLSIDQQWDCHVIRGRDVTNRRNYIKTRRLAYLDYFKRAMEQGNRSGQSDADNQRTRRRRFNLWICSCIAGRHRPSEIARRYLQLAGESIDRRIVSRQLETIPAKLRPS